MKSKSDSKYSSFEERWQWLISFMVVEDRFVHEILMMMDKYPTTSVPTIGVDVKHTRIVLGYNVKWCDSLSDAELRFVITHEIYHIVLHHCTHRMPENEEDRELYNSAADLAINCLIPVSANRTPPVNDKGKLIGCFPKKEGFPEKLSMEQYVTLLREKQEKDKKNGKDKGDGKGKGDGQGQPQPGNDSFDDHSGWEESEIVGQIIRDKVEQLAKDERVWGNMPGDTKAMIMAAQRSQINWTKYLRHYIGRLISSSKVSTMKRPDKRFGFPYPGRKHGYTDHKLVAIDTSGSVGDAELAQFLAEVNRLAEFNPVDLVLFDHDIQYGPKLFSKKKPSFDFKGRGGTCFEPVFKLASERKYQSVIMLTDGAAAAPEYPHGVRDVLWVICGDGQPPVEWGERVRVIPKGQPQEQNI